MLKKLIFTFIFLISLTGFSKKATITIVATTDTHGNLTSYDYLKKQDLDYGFMQASVLLKKLRKDKENVILVDCGDTLQGSPLIDYYVKNLFPKEPNPVIEVMNYLNYDVAVPGNHDFDFGRKYFENALNSSNFKWISANIYASETSEYIYTYSIVERSGIKVGFFGLTTPITQYSQPPKNLQGLIFKDLTDSAKKAVAQLQNEKVDLIVGLVHSGLGEENNKDKLIENACAQIAENVKGIDVILYGHSHKEMSYKTIGNTLLCQPGDYLKSMGVVLVDMQQRDGKWEVLGKSSTLLPLNGAKSDKKVLKKVKYVEREVEDYLNMKIGTLKDSIQFTDKPFNPGDGFVSYYKAISSFEKADVLMLPIPKANTLLVNNEEDLRVRNLYDLDKYGNYLVEFKIKGKDLKSLMEYSAAMLNPDGTVKSYVPLYNCDSFYNCAFGVDLSKDYGNRITINSINGKAFKDDDEYTVVTTTYRYGGGGDYFIGERPKAIKYSEITLRQMFLSIVENKKEEISNEEFF